MGDWWAGVLQSFLWRAAWGGVEGRDGNVGVVSGMGWRGVAERQPPVRGWYHEPADAASYCQPRISSMRADLSAQYASGCQCAWLRLKMRWTIFCGAGPVERG